MLALLAIAARDQGEVPLVLQALIYPMLDTAPVAPGRSRRSSARLLGSPPAGSAGAPFSAWNPAERDRLSSRRTGAASRILRALAPAFIAVGGVDLFVGEYIESRRLTEAGVQTEMLLVPGAFHGFDRVAPDTGPAKLFTETKHRALRRVR